VRFWLGTDKPKWLAEFDVPWMVADPTLRRVRRLPRALGPWTLDSGGFGELHRNGCWTFGADEYVGRVDRYRAEIGSLEWAAPQDWICDPSSLAATGLTVAEHQKRTVVSYLELRDRGPFIPMLQGWTVADYATHAEMYADEGVDLSGLPVVGIGSIAPRAFHPEAVDAVRLLSEAGIRLHGFGVKRKGFRLIGHLLASADSMAWSFNARKNPPLPGCDHASCRHCARFALRWRDETLRQLGQPSQLFLPISGN
jgi:hypothetical protein